MNHQDNTKQQLKSLLEQVLSPYLTLRSQEHDLFTSYFSVFEATPGSIIYHYGQVCQTIIMPTQGIFRAYTIHEGRQVNSRLLVAPAVVTSLTSLITSKPATEWLEAITTASGFRIDFIRLVKEHPNSLFVTHLRRILAEQHYLALDFRLNMLQCKTAQERLDAFCTYKGTDILEQIPAYHIASYLGITPETLSRIRKKSDIDKYQ